MEQLETFIGVFDYDRLVETNGIVKGAVSYQELSCHDYLC